MNIPFLLRFQRGVNYRKRSDFGRLWVSVPLLEDFWRPFLQDVGIFWPKRANGAEERKSRFGVLTILAAVHLSGHRIWRYGCCGPNGPLGRAQAPTRTEILSSWVPKMAIFDLDLGGGCTRSMPHRQKQSPFILTRLKLRYV